METAVNTESMVKKELIVLDAAVKDRDALFDALAENLQKYDYVAGDYAERLKEREREFPTGLQARCGMVALPHTNAEFVNKPFVQVWRLKDSVAFGRMDDPDETVQAEVVFNLGIKKSSDQVALLSRVIAILSNEELMGLVKQSGDVDEIYAALKGQLAEEEE